MDPPEIEESTLAQLAGKIHIPPGTVPMFRDTWIDMLTVDEALDLLEFRSGPLAQKVTQLS
jgi:hypothetical protein